MDSRFLAIVGLCVLPYIVGCDGDAPSGDGTVVTFDSVCDKGNEGKQVTLEGFLDFPEKFNAKASSIVMRLQAAPTRTSKVIGVSVKLNAGTNAVAAPRDKYNETDLRATTYDGKAVRYTTRVKVTGGMSYSDSLDSLAFKCFLTNPRIAIADAVVGK
jgi:hypothetical protein